MNDRFIKAYNEDRERIKKHSPNFQTFSCAYTVYITMCSLSFKGEYSHGDKKLMRECGISKQETLKKYKDILLNASVIDITKSTRGKNDTITIFSFQLKV